MQPTILYTLATRLTLHKPREQYRPAGNKKTTWSCQRVVHWARVVKHQAYIMIKNNLSEPIWIMDMLERMRGGGCDDDTIFTQAPVAERNTVQQQTAKHVSGEKKKFPNRKCTIHFCIKIWPIQQRCLFMKRTLFIQHFIVSLFVYKAAGNNSQ